MRRLVGTLLVVASIVVILSSCRPLERPVSLGSSADDRLLLVEETTKPTPHVQVRPVDPTTLANLPGYAPLSLGHNYASAVSSDGRTLAAFVWPTDNPQSGGTLHLIDLPSWTDTLPGVTISDGAGAFGFTEEGRALEWVVPTSHSPEHGVPQDFILERYDLARHVRDILARFPLTYSPTETRRLPSGNLAVYAIPTDAENLATDAPHVLIVDPSLQQITADVRLDEVKAWQYAEKESAGSDVSYRMYAPGLAWDLGHERLYVAAADSDHVVVVDLARGAILRQADLQPRASVVNRLVAWLVPTAEAKSEPMTRREAVLSPDGRRLYLVGSREGAAWTSTGLDVVDTTDLSRITHLDVPATDVEILPGRQRLALRLVWPAAGGQPNREAISVRDAERLDEIGRLTVDDAFMFAGCSRDGRLAYTSQWSRSANGSWRPQLQVVEVATHRVVAVRSFDDAPSGYVALLSTAPDRSASCWWS